MARGGRLQGLDAAMNALNREIQKIEGRTERGVYLAAEMIRGEAITLTPVDLGDLRASAKVVSAPSVFGGDDGPTAAITYGTDYAIVQHEDLSLSHDDGEAKFLEKAVNRNQDRALAIIAREAKVS